MSSHCLTCGGLIMEIGKSYGYAGPTCHCFATLKIQKPSNQNYISDYYEKKDESNILHPNNPALIQQLNELTTKLREAEAKLALAVEALVKYSESHQYACAKSSIDPCDCNLGDAARETLTKLKTPVREVIDLTDKNGKRALIIWQEGE